MKNLYCVIYNSPYNTICSVTYEAEHYYEAKEKALAEFGAGIEVRSIHIVA